MKKATGLGRGLSALLDEAVRTPPRSGTGPEGSRGWRTASSIRADRPRPNPVAFFMRPPRR